MFDILPKPDIKGNTIEEVKRNTNEYLTQLNEVIEFQLSELEGLIRNNSKGD